MTIIAWDGVTLAADKLAVSSGRKATVTKIKKAGNWLCGFAGSYSAGLIMLEWFENGGNLEKYPETQSDDEWAQLLVVNKSGVIKLFEKQPKDLLFEQKIFAIGSGLEYGLAVMHLGFDSIKAVEVASTYCNSCGNGVDFLRFD